jgi:hypothetical protein
MNSYYTSSNNVRNQPAKSTSSFETFDSTMNQKSVRRLNTANLDSEHLYSDLNKIDPSVIQRKSSQVNSNTHRPLVELSNTRPYLVRPPNLQHMQLSQKALTLEDASPHTLSHKRFSKNIVHDQSKLNNLSINNHQLNSFQEQSEQHSLKSCPRGYYKTPNSVNEENSQQKSHNDFGQINPFYENDQTDDEPKSSKEIGKVKNQINRIILEKRNEKINAVQNATNSPGFDVEFETDNTLRIHSNQSKDLQNILRERDYYKKLYEKVIQNESALMEKNSKLESVVTTIRKENRELRSQVQEYSYSLKSNSAIEEALSRLDEEKRNSANLKEEVKRMAKEISKNQNAYLELVNEFNRTKLKMFQNHNNQSKEELTSPKFDNNSRNKSMSQNNYMEEESTIVGNDLMNICNDSSEIMLDSRFAGGSFILKKQPSSIANSYMHSNARQDNIPYEFLSNFPNSNPSSSQRKSNISPLSYNNPVPQSVYEPNNFDRDEHFSENHHRHFS